VFEGADEMIKKVIDWCCTSQPYAEVEDVDIKWEKPTDEFPDFEIRH
jgi:acylphosphatase